MAAFSLQSGRLCTVFVFQVHLKQSLKDIVSEVQP